MQYQNVCLEAITCLVPEETLSSREIEARLAPLYKRLRLPEGRLEMMTGIAERRLWPEGTLPGEQSALVADKALRQAGIDRRHVGALLHGSVCRDYLEPATACSVHRRLGLSPDCLVFDVSNACLGVLNGVVQVANMIELGQIRAGLVVGTESSRTLLDGTIRRLNEDPSLTRADVKLAMASLTIGSGSAAILLVHRQWSRTGNRLLGGATRADTDFCGLCHSDRDPTVGGRPEPLMWTDSEALMREGIRAAQQLFPRFLENVGWDRGEVHKTFCHQVGQTHQKLLFEALQLDPAIDYPTLTFLGNTGSVALPITAALGIENGHLHRDDHLALLGIGSGINVLMLAVDWQTSLVEERSGLPSGRFSIS